MLLLAALVLRDGRWRHLAFCQSAGKLGSIGKVTLIVKVIRARSPKVTDEILLD
jgi:hypothetical protein